MSDIFENQAAFEGTNPPVAGEKPNGKVARRKGRAKKVVASTVSVAEPLKKRGRPAGAKAKIVRQGRPAAAKIASPTNGTGKLLLSVVGLDEAETQFVASMLAALENHPKKSRTKIVGALGRIFA